MKSPASAREEERKENNNKIVNHGGANSGLYSLWFIIFISVFYLLSGCFSRSAFADTVRQAELKNGMKILLKENHSLPLANVFLCVHSGSAQEGEFSGSGISHFIEHMLFKTTANRKPGEIFREVESYGGTINAFTSYDYTGYKITVPSEFLPAAVDILSDMAINATFEQKELEREREVILKEIRLSYDDPQRYASRLLWQTAYLSHPYKNPILGKEDLFNQLTRNDLLEFYQNRYTPENMVLTVVGDIQPDAVIEVIKESFEAFRRQPSARVPVSREPEQKQLRRHQEEFTAGLTYLLLGFHSVAFTDEDCAAMDVLATILGEGQSSRLYRQICRKKRLAYNIEAMNYTPQDSGLFIIYSLLEEKNQQRVLSLLLKQIEILKKKGVSRKELQSAKNKLISDTLFYNQTIEAQSIDLALNEIITGDFNYTERYIRKVKAVRAEDISKAAQKYLNQEELNIVALTPKDESAVIDPASIPTEKMNPGVENLARPPQVNKYLLHNGMTVLIRENKDLPLISINAVFKGGLRAEDSGTNGLCNLTAEMLDKGTRRKNAAEIAYLTESQGARLGCFSGNNSFGISLDILSEDFDPMLELLSELITDSTFPNRELQKQKGQNLAALKTYEDDIFQSGIKLLKATLFQKHPYGLISNGNEESLKKIKRRDLIEFHRKFCTGKNMVLSIFGDIDTRRALIKTKEYFADLNPGENITIAPVREPEIESLRRCNETLPKRQSLLLMGFPGVTVFDDDRYTLELLCQLLSQNSGRLWTRIREKQGLAYTLGAYSVFGLDPGYTVIYVATTAENVNRVKEDILEQLELLKTEPVSREELLQAKRAWLGKRLIGRQTNSACALESSLDQLYGLGYNHYLKYDLKIKGIQSADITRCVRHYFDSNKYALVVINPDK